MTAYVVREKKPGDKMTVTVEFSEENGKTRVTLVQTGLPDEWSDIVRGGWTAAFEKLGGFLSANAA